MLPLSFHRVVLIACLSAPLGYAETPFAPKTETHNGADALTLFGYMPKTAFGDAFGSAPEHTAIAPSPVLKVEEVRSSNGKVTVKIADYPCPEIGPNEFPVDNPGPLSRIRFGQSFRLGQHVVRPLALIGRKQVDVTDHDTEWAIDATGARITAEQARSLVENLEKPEERGHNPALWLVLESDTPLAVAYPFLRRVDTGDTRMHGEGTGTQIGSYAVKNRIIVAVPHPFLDAPPVELGFLIFGGKPEPMSVLAPDASVQSGSCVRRVFAGNTGSASYYPSVRRSTSVTSTGSSLSVFGKELLGPKQETRISHAEVEMTMSLEGNGSGAWFFFNEKMPPVRVASAFSDDSKQIWYNLKNSAPGLVYAFVFKPGVDLTPQRRPDAARILMSLPELPGEWPNRGVSNPLDWKVTFPGDRYKSGLGSIAPLDIELAVQTHGERLSTHQGILIKSASKATSYGWSAGHNLIPVKSGEVRTYREIIGMHYAKEIAEGREIVFDPELNRFVALLPESPDKTKGE